MEQFSSGRGRLVRGLPAHNNAEGVGNGEGRPATGKAGQRPGLSTPAEALPDTGEGVICVDDATYHEMKYDSAEPDPYPGDDLAKRRRLEMLDIRPAVTVYKPPEE